MPLLPPVISTTFPSNPSFMPFPPAGAECSIVSHVARITLGLGTSQGPMLSVAPEIWPERVNADRVNPQHFHKRQNLPVRRIGRAPETTQIARRRRVRR